MRRLGRTLALGLALAMGTVACNAQDVQDDPRGALRDAVIQLRDYDGIEVVLGAQLDDAALASAQDEGGLSEQELAILGGATLTARMAPGDDDSHTEVIVAVGDEAVGAMRSLGGDETYVQLDLPAVERVASELGAADFSEMVSSFETIAERGGLGHVVTAAREGDWVRLAGMGAAAGMIEPPSDQEPDEAEAEQLTRELGARLLDFLDDPELDIRHVDSEAAGQRVRITAEGPQLRTLAGDLLDIIDGTATAAADSIGLGAGELRRQLEESIADDFQLSLDAWIEGGELSQIAVDLLELARQAEQDDVPDGELLITMGLSEFTGDIDAPETEVTLDIMDLVGAALAGALDDLDGLVDGASQDPLGDELDAMPDPDAMSDLDPEACLPAPQAEQLAEGLGQDPSELDGDEIEALLGLPIC